MNDKQATHVNRERQIGICRQDLLPGNIFSFSFVFSVTLCLVSPLAWGQMPGMMDPEQMEVAIDMIGDQDLGHVLSGLPKDSMKIMQETPRWMDQQQAESLGISVGSQSSIFMNMPIDLEQAKELIPE